MTMGGRKLEKEVTLPVPLCFKGAALPVSAIGVQVVTGSGRPASKTTADAVQGTQIPIKVTSGNRGAVRRMDDGAFITGVWRVCGGAGDDHGKNNSP